MLAGFAWLIVFLDATGFFARILFGIAFFLSTIGPVLVSLKAIILYLTTLLPARLLCVACVPPILPTILPPIRALRFRITR
jgi:hypothetical protein